MIKSNDMKDARFFRVGVTDRGDDLILQVGGTRFDGWLWRRGNNDNLISMRQVQEVHVKHLSQFGKLEITAKEKDQRRPAKGVTELAIKISELIAWQTETDNLGDLESIVFMGELPCLNLVELAEELKDFIPITK